MDFYLVAKNNCSIWYQQIPKYEYFYKDLSFKISTLVSIVYIIKKKLHFNLYLNKFVFSVNIYYNNIMYAICIYLSQGNAYFIQAQLIKYC